MLLIVGEPIVAYQRDVTHDPDAPFSGPWASGSPAICAYVAGRLGVPTVFAGAVGDDDRGRVMREGLAAGGVDVSHLAVRAELPTAWAQITYQGAEREFAFHVTDSAATDLQREDLGDLPDRADWLHLSGSALIFGGSLGDTALAALERAKSGGARVSVDPNVRPDSLTPDLLSRLRESVSLADIVLPSQGELEALDIDPAHLVSRGAVVCTTDGERGATVMAPRAPKLHIPAVRVTAVDTDGAGDSFAAGFIAGVRRGLTMAESAALGTRVAAAAVTVPGPMTVRFEDTESPDLR